MSEAKKNAVVYKHIGRWHIAEEHAEAPDTAETRLWAAVECLKKSGLPPEAPVVLESTSADGWVLLRSGRRTVLTCIASVLDLSEPIAIAVALDCQSSPPD